VIDPGQSASPLVGNWVVSQGRPSRLVAWEQATSWVSEIHQFRALIAQKGLVEAPSQRVAGLHHANPGRRSARKAQGGLKNFQDPGASWHKPGGPGISRIWLHTFGPRTGLELRLGPALIKCLCDATTLVCRGLPLRPVRIIIVKRLPQGETGGGRCSRETRSTPLLETALAASCLFRRKVLKAGVDSKGHLPLETLNGIPPAQARGGRLRGCGTWSSR